MLEILHYLTPIDERDLYGDWLGKLKDVTAKIAIVRRIIRIEQGNFGDHKFCRDGVWECRIDVGAGYRVYYAIAGRQADSIAALWWRQAQPGRGYSEGM